MQISVRSSVSRRCIRSNALYLILEYDYIPDILERRGPHREKHLSLAQEKADQGKIVMAGATGDPVSKALFIWKDVSTKVSHL